MTGASQRYGAGNSPLGAYQKVRLPNHFPKTPEDHEDNIRELERIDWGNATGTRWATIVVAAPDSTANSKATADYVLTASGGTNTLSTIVTAMLARSLPGRIIFLEGTYSISALTMTFGAGDELVFQGMGNSDTGPSAIITASSSSALLTANGTTSAASFFGVQNIGVVNTGSGQAIVTNKVGLIADNSYFSSAGRTLDLSGGASGPGVQSIVRNCYIRSTSSSGTARGIVVTNDNGGSIIHGNHIVMSSTTGSRGMSIFSGGGWSMTGIRITDNYVTGAAQGIYLLDTTDASNVKDFVVANNTITTCTTGIQLEGVNGGVIEGNMIYANGTGINATGPGIIGNSRVLITSNLLLDNTADHIKINTSTLGTRDIAVIFNKVRGTTSGGSITIGAGCTNCAMAYNDTYGAGTVTDSGTATRREADFFTGTGTGGLLPTGGTSGQALLKNSSSNYDASWADIHQVLTGGSTSQVLGKNSGTNYDYSWIDVPVKIDKNGTLVGTRPEINLIEGSNVTMTVSDNSGSNRIDVTVNSTGSGGGGNTSGQLVFIFDGGGSALIAASTPTVDVVAPFAGTITDWVLTTDGTDSVVVDVWADTYTNYPPTVLDTITGSAKPQTSSAVKAASSTLTGWTTSITAGYIFRAHLDSVTSSTHVTLTINYSRP